MKEINEYTAEVIRRAAAKKAKRRAKLTRAAGAACAALVCVAGLISASRLLRPTFDGTEELSPSFSPAAESFNDVKDGDMSVAATDTPVTDGITDRVDDCKYACAEIWLDGEQPKLVLSPAADEVADALSEALSKSSVTDGVDVSVPEAVSAAVHIKLTDADGNTEEYLLSDNMLYCVDSGAVYQVPENALTELMKRLCTGE